MHQTGIYIHKCKFTIFHQYENLKFQTYCKMEVNPWNLNWNTEVFIKVNTQCITVRFFMHRHCVCSCTGNVSLHGQAICLFIYSVRKCFCSCTHNMVLPVYNKRLTFSSGGRGSDCAHATQVKDRILGCILKSGPLLVWHGRNHFLCHQRNIWPYLQSPSGHTQ